MPPAITIENLQVRFGDAIALTDLDLCVEPGTSLAVIGRNGSGKSTLLGAIAGLFPPSRGTVSLASTTAPALVLQSTDVDERLPITAWDTVSIARYPTLGLLRRFGPNDRREVTSALERLDVGGLAAQQLRTLSGGQRQRVLVAQGLAQRADVLLLDEPVIGLDVTSRTLILDVIDDELEAGRTVVVTTHDLEDARRCDQVVLLDTTPVAIGPPEEVLTEDHLHRAFGGRVVRVGDEFLLDDPHHDHHHH